MIENKKIVQGITVLTILIYAILLIGWHIMPATEEFAIQAPGADNRPEGLARSATDVKIGEFFMNYAAETSDLTGKWTSFRGEDHTNIIQTPESIDVSGDDYKEIWNIDTGEGHAAPVIYNGKVYLLDYDEKLSSDALRCFSLATGKELWRRWYRVPIKRNHGFSRTIPAINQDVIITIGPEGHVMCCNPQNGDMLWSLDMRKKYDTEVPFWYTGQCPYLDGNTLVLAPAGKDVLLTGINCQTGEELWSTPNTLGYKMSHSSISPMTLKGQKTYVYAGVGGVCGVSASKQDAGKLLWETNAWQPSVVAPSPVKVGDNRLFVVAGYGSGGALIQVDGAGSQWKAKVVEQHKPNSGISCEQQTPIFYKNKLISVMPKDGGRLRGKLVIYAPSDLHIPLWSSATDERFGLGPYLVINDYLLAFNDTGELFVYAMEADGMSLLKRQILLEGIDAWGPMAFADGMLIVRDAHHVKCFKII